MNSSIIYFTRLYNKVYLYFILFFSVQDKRKAKDAGGVKE